MVANCCVCKAHPVQQKDVTFHKIPKNENLANKWITIISGTGINISKTATVCSKHFDDSQFQYRTVSGTIKIEYVTAPLRPRQSQSNSDQDSAREEKDDVENNMVYEAVLDIELVNNETMDENSTLSKRKDNSTLNTDRKHTRVKTIRYIGDIDREDFTSDDAYRVVKNYVADYTNEIKILQQKVRRLDKKIKTVKDLTDNLRSNNMLTSQAAEFIEVSTRPN